MFNRYLLVAAVTACLLRAGLPAQGAPNLVLDGGFEEVRREALFRSPYLEKSIKDGVRLSREGEDAIVPANFDQFCAAKVMKVVEGTPGGMVHSGAKALLLQGGIYLRPGAPRNFATHEGDMYHIEFYAKGKGEVTVWFTVYGTGKVGTVRVENRGKAVPSQWTKIEQTFLIVGAGAEQFAPRLAATEEVLIDDLAISMISRNDEASPSGQPASPPERSKAAFVYPLKTSPASNAGIDDPSWEEVPEFSGFLSYGDQSLLAEPVTTMKLGYDAANLYARIDCDEPDMSIVSLLDRYQDIATPRYIGPTAVELFLDPGCSRLSWYQFSATARGHKFQGSSRKEGDWSAPWEVQSRIGAGGYTLLLRIPFTLLGVPRPAVGDVWGLNVCRSRDTFHSTWSPVGSNFHNPAGFGRLVFGSFEQWFLAAYVPQTKQIRGEILDRADRLGMTELGGRVDLVDAYAVEVERQMEKRRSGGRKDWRRIASLYGMAGFVLDSYRRILTCTEWAALSGTPHAPREVRPHAEREEYGSH